MIPNREERQFRLVSQFKPQGDQPQAIEKLVQGIQKNQREQVLLGVTGSGKTFTMANVVARINKPTLVIAPNKTLAAQLYNEFRDLFPDNAVRYFVSYYDYYQPEAYVPSTDTYIEKDASINDEIDKLRHSATKALLERSDTLIVASVSCIYGLGSPEAYFDMLDGNGTMAIGSVFGFGRKRRVMPAIQVVSTTELTWLGKRFMPSVTLKMTKRSNSWPAILAGWVAPLNPCAGRSAAISISMPPRKAFCRGSIFSKS